jgi:hypothetical protein
MEGGVAAGHSWKKPINTEMEVEEEKTNLSEQVGHSHIHLEECEKDSQSHSVRNQ